MKKNFVKVSAILTVVAAVAASATWAGEVVIKRGALDLVKRPAKSQFATPAKTAPAMACVGCKPQFVPTRTQDAKLTTKTIFVEQHACKSCETTIKSVGYQKAARKDIAVHTCAGRLASATTCCSATPANN
jgi:hypothetical protein